MESCADLKVPRELRQRMIRVALQTCHEGQHFLFSEARGDELFSQLRRTISQRPRLVENRGSTLGDLFKHDVEALTEFLAAATAPTL